MGTWTKNWPDKNKLYLKSKAAINNRFNYLKIISKIALKSQKAKEFKKIMIKLKNRFNFMWPEFKNLKIVCKKMK